jgi:hypothetical protein
MGTPFSDKRFAVYCRKKCVILSKRETLATSKAPFRLVRHPLLGHDVAFSVCASQQAFLGPRVRVMEIKLKVEPSSCELF